MNESNKEIKKQIENEIEKLEKLNKLLLDQIDVRLKAVERRREMINDFKDDLARLKVSESHSWVGFNRGK